MKYLVVIALLALLLFLIYRRLRPYIKTLREILDAVRQIQSAGTKTSNPDGKPEKLVCCATCGTWVPSGRALSARSGDALFCSAKCLNERKTVRQRS